MPAAVRTRIPFALIAGALLLALAGAPRVGVSRTTLAVGLVALAFVASAGYLIWTAKPCQVFTVAIMLAPFSGNWQAMGIPGTIAPDRLLVAGGILTVLLRGPAIRDRPPLRMRAVHWALVLAAAYAFSSAFFSHTLFHKVPGLRLVEAFGLIPFLAFTLAPVVFPTARERAVLLKGLVVLGGYLSLTTLLEMMGPKSLVFPRYILDPNYGIHVGRGRGPFADAVANGFGLYVCAVACVIATCLWKRRLWRALAGVIAALCLVGTLLTLERSVWIGTVAGTIVVLAVVPSTRRLVIPAVLVGALAVLVILSAFPSLSVKVSARAQSQISVWDRENTDRVALNMIYARPLFGFGWDRYLEFHLAYYQQSAEYPITDPIIDIPSTPLTYGVELGLVGLTLWIAALLIAVGGALFVRGPPDLVLWRNGLLAIFVFYAIIENFIPPTVFPNLIIWLWAGVLWSVRYPLRTASRVLADD